MSPGNRILVLGCPGSGKSVFAVRLQQITGLPLTHLDSVWWRADRKHISREEFDQRLDALLAAEKWIIDGDYSRTWERRIQACDTVILLDPGTEQCLQGIRERVSRDRPDLPWPEERPDPALEEKVLRYSEEKLPLLLSLKNKYPDRQWLIFRSRAQADSWLMRLGK